MSGSLAEVIKAVSTQFVVLLKVCAQRKDLSEGIRIHANVLKRGLLQKNLCLASALINMYAKCGAVDEAHQVLDELPARDVVTWSALIAGYTQKGHGKEALHCFERMKFEGLSPNAVILACILKACSSIGAADEGEQIHDEILSRGLLENNVMLGNSLIHMYATCGMLAKAQQVLEEVSGRNVISWSTLIAGYVQHGYDDEALKCFEWMHCDGLSPDAVTFICILKACGHLKAFGKGEKFHDEIVNKGLLGKNIQLGSALIDMYIKCGVLMKAQQVLDELPTKDTVTWNALISGYAHEGQGREAINCYERMQGEGCFPDATTLTCVLRACGSIGAAEIGEHIHNEIDSQGLLWNDIVLGTALIDMYAKCGLLLKAQQVLDKLSVRNIVSWSALIAGYVKHGYGEKALDCFKRMQREGLSPNAVTFSCILKAYRNVGAADKGEQVHDKIIKQGLLEDNIVLGNALVDMYAKCGRLAQAQHVLNELPVRDTVSWNSLIVVYAQQGEGGKALECLEKMQDDGFCGDMVTFASVLKACGNIGAVDKGRHVHCEIIIKGLSWNDTVLGTALVDMYAKCSALIEAEQVLNELPIQSTELWNAVLAGFAHQGQGKGALTCFERMQTKGHAPDAVTFACLLNACSCSGLMEEGQLFLSNMSQKYGITPDIGHKTCIVDLCGRLGQFDKALAMMNKMPSVDDPAIWSSLLGACVKWGNVKVGRWAFKWATEEHKDCTEAHADADM